MQEHVQLEVSLEIIMAEIANSMFELSTATENDKIKKQEGKLMNLINLQESAYSGKRDAVLKILKREF